MIVTIFCLFCFAGIIIINQYQYLDRDSIERKNNT